MQRLPSHKLEAGMVLAQDIVTKHGQTIAKEGSVLTDAQIARLSFYNISSILVEDPEGMEPEPEPEPKKEPEPIISEEKNETIPYSQRLKGTSEYQDFQLNYSKNIHLMKETFKKVMEGKAGDKDFPEIISAIETLTAQKTPLDILDLLHHVRGLDDSVYAHSLNVALITRAIGSWLKMDRQGLNVLTLAAYFHDIGKLQVPEEVLNKTGKLTDEEFALIRSHPQKSRKILSSIPHIDGRILASALQHHERFDGSGYPRGLEGDEIDTTASIVAIADVYDAMTAARTYRAPKSAFEVIEAFEEDGLQKYDPKVITTFLNRIASAYQNSRVILNDGRSCRVVYINSGKLSKPMVQFDDGEVLDLSRTSGISITSVI